MTQPPPLVASLEGPAGAPVLVLGNSLGTTREVWEPQAAVLGERLPAAALRAPRARRVARAARRRTRSASWARTCSGCWTPSRCRAASYCGISLGGMIGMWLAAHAPERIDGLGLCCTSAYLPPARLWTGRAAQVRAGGHGVASPSRSWAAGSPRRSAPVTPRSPRPSRGRPGGGGPGGLRGLLRGDRGAWTCAPRSRAITAPTLVIAGAEDPATPPWHGAVIAQGIGRPAWPVIRGAAHLANVSAARLRSPPRCALTWSRPPSGRQPSASPGLPGNCDASREPRGATDSTGCPGQPRRRGRTPAGHGAVDRGVPGLT